MPILTLAEVKSTMAHAYGLVKDTYPGMFHHQVSDGIALEIRILRDAFLFLSQRCMLMLPENRAKSLCMTPLEDALMRGIQSLALTGTLVDQEIPYATQRKAPRPSTISSQSPPPDDTSGRWQRDHGSIHTDAGSPPPVPQSVPATVRDKFHPSPTGASTPTTASPSAIRRTT
mgnify:CR=1 FL=1